MGSALFTDTFRGKEGAFDASLRGIRLCAQNDIKVGLRFTMTMDNEHQLPDLLQLADDDNVGKFYLSHLVYAGRGKQEPGRRCTA